MWEAEFGLYLKRFWRQAPFYLSEGASESTWSFQQTGPDVESGLRRGEAGWRLASESEEGPEGTRLGGRWVGAAEHGRNPLTPPVLPRLLPALVTV